MFGLVRKSAKKFVFVVFRMRGASGELAGLRGDILIQTSRHSGAIRSLAYEVVSPVLTQMLDIWR